jgi:hypothetical protein
MSRCPLAAWKPLGDDPTHQPLMSKYDLVIIHTMVGTLAGTDAMFRAQGYVGVESHFGTGYVGGKCVAYQWCDTARTADANLDGNPRAISIENADTASPYPAWKGSEVPPFTDDQCELIAQITAWACKTHGIPAKLAPDSRPTSRGIAWHRQGIDPYRVSGGEKWSDSYGKVCPGDKRIEQIKSVIVPRVQEIMSGHDQQGNGGDGVKHQHVLDAQHNVAGARNLLVQAVKDNPDNKQLTDVLTPVIDSLADAYRELYPLNK